MRICQVSFINVLYLRDLFLSQHQTSIQMILGTSPPEPVAEEYEDDAAELEEEEMESIQVSEKEFDFLDFIKR